MFSMLIVGQVRFIKRLNSLAGLESPQPLRARIIKHHLPYFFVNKLMGEKGGLVIENDNK